MISSLYIILSMIIFVIQFKLSTLIPKKYAYAFPFVLFCGLSGVIHFRVFTKGGIWGFDLSDLFSSLFSLLSFLITVSVPINRLSKRPTQF